MGINAEELDAIEARANAREDVSLLIAEVRRLTADLSAMTTSRDEWRSIAQAAVKHRASGGEAS